MPLGVEQFGRAHANRIRRGLYAGRSILFGNKVSEDGGNRSRRKWLPNAQRKRVYSQQLDTLVQLRVTAGALRNIDKAGGLDNYVFKIRNSREDSDKAEQIRQQIQKSRQIQKELRGISELKLKAQTAQRKTLLPAAAAAAALHGQKPDV